jgi:hypothetical protein
VSLLWGLVSGQFFGATRSASTKQLLEGRGVVRQLLQTTLFAMFRLVGLNLASEHVTRDGRQLVRIS